MRLALGELLDRAPPAVVSDQIIAASHSVDGVLATEKLRVRKSGINYFVDLHVQVDPMMTIYAAHIVGGKVKGAIRRAVPSAVDILLHIEPRADSQQILEVERF